MKILIKVCPVCRGIFKNGRKKYCSRKCLKEGTNQRTKKRFEVFREQLGWDKI